MQRLSGFISSSIKIASIRGCDTCGSQEMIDKDGSHCARCRLEYWRKQLNDLETAKISLPESLQEKLRDRYCDRIKELCDKYFPELLD